MKKRSLIFILCAVGLNSLSAADIKMAKLRNGLTVIVSEDMSKPNVFGMVSVNVGSKQDPLEFTGLAHYLEHVMFKGTTTIGALDWEKEEPLYAQIIAKYDEKASTTDPVKKEEINKQINELTIEASRLSQSNEFSKLVAFLGGTGLNAGTNFDYTIYYNSFPASQVDRFLELYAERLVDPVFRAFQPELETVYEEYNMYADMAQQSIFSFIMENIFPNHPYGRPIIGKPEHLKNPQLSKLIEFYKQWYSPDNMALILVGNIKMEDVLPIVNEKFSRLIKNKLPQKQVYSDMEIKGKRTLKSKMGDYPMLVMTYNGASAASIDQIGLQVISSLLSNRTRTGLLDKKVIDGDALALSIENIALSDAGRLMFTAIPAYDPAQRSWGSFKGCQKMILEDVERLKNGEYESSLLESIKLNMLREYELSIESNKGVAMVLSECFLNGLSFDMINTYPEKLMQVDAQQISALAKKYFTSDILCVEFDEGKVNNKTKIDKPNIKPIEQPNGVKSPYASWFESMDEKPVSYKPVDFSEVKSCKINDRSQLYYTLNTTNPVFTLVIKYGVGSREMPYLQYSTLLMNNAGVLGQYEPQEFKKAFAGLNASCSYSVDEDYLYVILEGTEERLVETLNLLTRQILLPKLDEKQLRAIQGSVIQSRLVARKNSELIGDAMYEYLLYNKKSSYIDRPTIKQVFYDMGTAKLTGELQRATDYAAEIHYVGSLPFEQVKEILEKNLPLKQGEKESLSPQKPPYDQIKESKVIFLPKSGLKQSKVHFYMPIGPFDPSKGLVYSLFNEYFSGGFSGLILEQIRENNSMAYTADARLILPDRAGDQIILEGYIGTQSDKANDAVDLFMKLLRDMPIYAERETGTKSYFRNMLRTQKPSFRSLSQYITSWRLRGYNTDPAELQINALSQTGFEDLKNFYDSMIKDKPIGIAIIGDPKKIDVKRLEKHGKLMRIYESTLFSENDF